MAQVLALLVAGASAQFWPYSAYPYVAGHHYVTPYATHGFIPQEAIKKEWDQKDGSLKAIKIDEKKLAEYYPFYYRSTPYYYPYAYPAVEKKEESRIKRDDKFASSHERDFAYSSVDKNQDGFPDNKFKSYVIPVNHQPVAYSYTPYAYTPYAYSHYPYFY